MGMRVTVDSIVPTGEPYSLRLQLFPDWYQFAGKRTTGGTRRAV